MKLGEMRVETGSLWLHKRLLRGEEEQKEGAKLRKMGVRLHASRPVIAEAEFRSHQALAQTSRSRGVHR